MRRRFAPAKILLATLVDRKAARAVGNYGDVLAITPTSGSGSNPLIIVGIVVVFVIVLAVIARQLFRRR